MNITYRRISILCCILLMAQLSALGAQPPGPPIIPQISANPTFIPADGISNSTVIVLYLDEQGNPITGANVYFSLPKEGMGNISTAFGYFDGLGWFNLTDNNGRAMATFTAGTTVGDVIVMVNAGNVYNSTHIELVSLTPPNVVNASANPSEILLEEPGNIDYAHMSTMLNVIVTNESGLANVTINLSSIGGSPVQPMTNIGGNIWSCAASAISGNGIQELNINVTDVNGKSNSSVNITLKVTRNGDVDENGIVNLNDAIYLANHVLHVPGYEVINELASDVDGNGIVNLNDAIYLANHVLHVPGYEMLH